MDQLENFQAILQKEMSRKEFLQHIAVFIVGAIGITGLMNHFFKLSNYQPGSKPKSALQSNGYGARTYGR